MIWHSHPKMTVMIQDIGDHESLKAWLNALPFDDEEAQKIAVAIATRAALRVLPIAWDFNTFSTTARERNLTALPILWRILTSGVAAVSPTPDVKATADALSSAALSTLSAALSSSTADALSALSAYATLSAAALSALFASYARSAIWEVIRRDCDVLQHGPQPIFFAPLWHDMDNASADAWAELRKKLEQDKVDWSFWIGFYDAALAGRFVNWTLYEKIATSSAIPWDAPAAEVNAAIQAIVDAWAAENANTGEVIEFDAEQGHFTATPITAKNTPRLERALFKLQEIHALIQEYGNYAGILRGELFLIDRALAEHRDNAFKVYHDTDQALILLRGNIRIGHCPTSSQEPVIGLFETTLLDVKDMLGDEPEVRPERVEKAKAAFGKLSEEDIRAISDTARELALVSDEALARDLIKDAEILEDATRENAIRAMSFLFAGGRVVKAFIIARYKDMHKLLDEAVITSEKVKKITLNLTKIAAAPASIYVLSKISSSALFQKVVEIFSRWAG